MLDIDKTGMYISVGDIDTTAKEIDEIVFFTWMGGDLNHHIRHIDESRVTNQFLFELFEGGHFITAIQLAYNCITKQNAARTDVEALKEYAFEEVVSDRNKDKVLSKEFKSSMKLIFILLFTPAQRLFFDMKYPNF